jgi:DNA-binding NtrC family response regulator
VATHPEAFALLSQQDFIAVVAEYHLTGGTGLSLYQESRRRCATLPFILMCGGASVALPDPYFRFLSKPFSIWDLTSALETMIASAPDPTPQDQRITLRR